MSSRANDYAVWAYRSENDVAILCTRKEANDSALISASAANARANATNSGSRSNWIVTTCSGFFDGDLSFFMAEKLFHKTSYCNRDLEDLLVLWKS